MFRGFIVCREQEMIFTQSRLILIQVFSYISHCFRHVLYHNVVGEIQIWSVYTLVN